MIRILTIIIKLIDYRCIINENYFLTLSTSFISNDIQRYRNEEGRNPKLATIQSLTRGTGNHDGPTVSFRIGGAGSRGKPIEIHVHN